MAYIGNEPGVGTFIVSTERFNGTGSCTQFTITQTGIDDANAIEVIVSSVQQDPINSYSITNGVITFTEAPPSGTQNIIVTYRATTVITFSSITTSQILDGQITASKIASGVLPSAAANSAGVYANSAFASANLQSGVNTTQNTNITNAGTYANAAFATANTVSSASSYANSAFLTANTPNHTANSASSYANSGFAAANSASLYANSSFSKANNALTAGANTTTSVQLGSLGIGTAASGTTGEIRATSNITAYYSDDRLKTRLGKIENALYKVNSLTGFYYEPNELAQGLGYTIHRQVGLSAQTMQNVMPEIVTTAPIDDKYLTIWYEKTVPLLVEAIKELSNEVEEIKKKLQ